MRPALRIAVTLAALGAVVWLVAPAEVAGTLRGLQPGWLALAVVALTAQIWLSALRWRVTARALGHELARGWAVREYGLSVAANSFLPGGVLGDLARIARSRHLGWGGAAGSVLIERLAGQIALATLALAAVAIWLGDGRGALLLVAALLVGGILVRIFPKPARLLALAWFSAGVWPVQGVLTLAILGANLTGFWAAAAAVGIRLDAGTAALLIPLTLMAMLIPLTINGWGLREGLAAALWPALGIAAAPAVAASVAFGLACMAAALIGLAPWLAHRQRPAADASGSDPLAGPHAS